MLRYLIISLCLSQATCLIAQQPKSKLVPDAVGITYGLGNENTVVFNDDDYLYKTQYLKASFQYELTAKKYRIGLAIQPQVHFIQHQLLNIFFVKPTDENFEQNRTTFSRLKSMRLYGLTFEINVRRKIFRKTDVLAFFAIGPATIDTQTERLAKGFTFIDNLGIGIRYELLNSIFLELKPTYSHVSNARLQLPNSGYNVLNLEIGLSWNLRE